LEQKDYEHFIVEKRSNGVAILTLRRGDREDPRNSLDDFVHREFYDLPPAIQEDDDVRAVVLTGAGEHFTVGADLSAGRRVSGVRRTKYDLFLGEALQLVTRFVELDKPVITAVRGYCLGLGSTIAMSTDVVIAGESAKFGDPHVSKVGVTAGDGNAALWPLLIGPHRAKYFLMTGEHVPAHAAYEYGLVHQVVPDDKVLETAIEIADRLAALPPLAVRSTKAAIQRYVSLIVQTVLPFSLAAEGFVLDTDDAQEARTAWAEKRPPNFTGLDDMARTQAEARAAAAPSTD
jgi:enoyl-CoA hydratase